MGTNFMSDVKLNGNKVLGASNLVTKEELAELRAEILSNAKPFVQCGGETNISQTTSSVCHIGTWTAKSLDLSGLEVTGHNFATKEDLEILEGKLSRDNCDTACKAIHDNGKTELRVNEIERAVETLQQQMKMMQSVVDGLQNQMRLIREVAQPKKNVCIMR